MVSMNLFAKVIVDGLWIDQLHHTMNRLKGIIVNPFEDTAKQVQNMSKSHEKSLGSYRDRSATFPMIFSVI